MPDFDGTGPLKRGQMIGRGRGPCRKNTDGMPATGYRTRIPRSKKN